MIKVGDKFRLKGLDTYFMMEKNVNDFYNRKLGSTLTVDRLVDDTHIGTLDGTYMLVLPINTIVFEPEHFTNPEVLKGYDGQLVDKNPRVNIDQFFVRDNTCSSGKKVWESSTLFAAAKGLEPYDLQLSAIDLSTQFATANTVALFLYQMKRVQESNLDYPIIQAPDGWIMDGLHRIVKAILQGETTIKAVRLPVLPEPDRTEE